MQNLKKSVGLCNIRRVNSYLTVERSIDTLPRRQSCRTRRTRNRRLSRTRRRTRRLPKPSISRPRNFAKFRGVLQRPNHRYTEQQLVDGRLPRSHRRSTTPIDLRVYLNDDLGRPKCPWHRSTKRCRGLCFDAATAVLVWTPHISSTPRAPAASVILVLFCMNRKSG